MSRRPPSPSSPGPRPAGAASPTRYRAGRPARTRDDGAVDPASDRRAGRRGHGEHRDRRTVQRRHLRTAAPEQDEQRRHRVPGAGGDGPSERVVRLAPGRRVGGERAVPLPQQYVSGAGQPGQVGQAVDQPRPGVAEPAREGHDPGALLEQPDRIGDAVQGVPAPAAPGQLAAERARVGAGTPAVHPRRVGPGHQGGEPRRRHRDPPVGTVCPMSSPKAADNGSAGADRIRASTIKAPPSDEPKTAPQSPATCASAQSARPRVIRQTARRGTGPAGMRHLGLAGSLGGAVAGTRAVGLLGVAVLVGAWLGLRRVTGPAPGAGPDSAGRRADTRWLLVTAGLWALPLLVAPPLFSGDAGAYACQGQLYLHHLNPYRHGAADLPCTWLDRTPPLWRHSPAPYGPLWVVLSGAAATTGSYLGAVVVLRAVALAGIALAIGYGLRLARILDAAPSRVAWLGTAGPLVLLHGVSGVHNDALLAGLVVAGLAYAATGRWGLRAGVLLGLALAVKVTALVAVPFAVLVIARDRRPAALARATAGVAVGAGGAFAAGSAPAGPRPGPRAPPSGP